MALSWNEIKSRAIEFSKEWKDDFNEHAEAKSFMDAFFNVFGIPRRRVATFEQRVKKEDGRQGFIDLLWKGTILIEFKSRGKNLEKAHAQAKDYFPGIKDADLPKYILVCDFENFRLYDLEEAATVEFKLADLVKNVQHFGYLLGYQKKIYKEQDPANVKAAELMGRLHDRLEEIGYGGHALEIYLVRILFCLFAEDTTIFNKQQFQEFIEQRTSEDGSDLAPRLQELFQVLNTEPEKRFRNLDEQLADFPYVNGKLFEEPLPIASFDGKMRQALLDCCYLDWSKISPAIFGSMFQSVMNPQERRNLGAHYTSETNILKLIKPLFLDDLWRQFDAVKDNRNRLQEFHQKLSRMKFLDPACGCGNFLVVTYRELRLLEIEILKALNKQGQRVIDISVVLRLDVDMMCGIEYEEFPARIAEVAMWLIDHQMNMLVSNEFGQYYVRLPLRKSAKIVHANALQIDWETVVSQNELSFILGNPPFYGAMWLNVVQRNDVKVVMGNISKSGVLDYVSCWYVKTAKYIENTAIKAAFVSTNSITQGEQAGILWGYLFSKHHLKIHFAHRTFKWNNEARGNAAVHCVIIGFANFDTNNKLIFEYENIKGIAHETKAKNINQYLVDAPEIVIIPRNEPISNVPKMTWGSQPRDGGHFIFSEQEYLDLINNNTEIGKYLRLYLGGRELINNQKRYCLWLKDVEPSDLKKFPIVLERIALVKKFRLESVAKSTQNFASTPTLFAQIAQPSSDYLAIPEVSSERRKYIPIGFLRKNVIASNKLQMLPNATLLLFGILTSEIHMSWVRNICGRLKSDFSYSNSLVYNNFPFPENPNERQIKTIEEKAQKVLDARGEFPNSSLADLYDPLTMPPALVRAHNELDKAVDLAYRPQPFTGEANRMAFLFELYEKYTANLFTEKTRKSKGKKG
jgi:hypothetical protein